jgi:amino acid transporter
LALRKSLPDQHRPFKLPFAHGIGLIAFYICNLLIFWTGWETVSKMMFALSIGLIFFAFHCRKKGDLWLSQWRASWWLIPYFALLALISWLGSFGGGKNILPFGWDFLIIGILTVIVFVVAPGSNNAEKV